MPSATISIRDQRLLSTFPRPPQGPLSPSKSPLPSPGPYYRASNFGHIHVGLSRDDDSDSLYDEPIEKASDYASQPILPIPLPSVNNTELQLVLDNPSRVYSPSETVTGYLFGWNPSSTNIHIILEGRAKTYIREGKIHYKDRAPLLYQIFQLKPDEQGVIPRFSIKLPEKATGGLEKLNDFAPRDIVYGRYWTHEWPMQEPYECQAGHPLPPSMTMPLRTSITLSSHAQGVGYITYKLIAVRSKLDSATGKIEPDASCQVPIKLTTRRLPPSRIYDLVNQKNVTQSDLSVQTVQLSKVRQLSLSEQLRDAFNKSAPAFYFRANITAPKLSIPGGDLKVSIAVSVLPPPIGRSYHFPIPDISVSALLFRIRSFTGLRVTRLSDQNDARTHTFKHDELRLLPSATGAIFKPKDGDFEGQSCVSTIALPKSILPSFKTYNLWRGYRLECDITFLVAGKEITASSKNDLNIVAQPSESKDTMNGQRQGLDGEDDAASLELAQAMAHVVLQSASVV